LGKYPKLVPTYCTARYESIGGGKVELVPIRPFAVLAAGLYLKKGKMIKLM
jgi:hypothetical protein